MADKPTSVSLVSPDEILRATERRNPTAVSVPGRAPGISGDGEFEPWDLDNPVRQEFRRLLDPGILRNNDKKDAAISLRAWIPIHDSLS